MRDLTDDRHRRSRGLAYLIAVALAALILVVAGCGGDEDSGDGGASTSGDSGTPATAAKDELTIAIPSELRPLDPQLYSNSYNETVTNQIYEALLWVGPDVEREIQPLLAEDMPERIDDTTWRFKIKDGISFTNGEPLDAAAVVYSIKRIVDPEVAAEQGEYVNTVKTAKAVDDHTVDVITKAADEILPNRMLKVRIVPPKYFEEAGEKASEEPVGTGPYKWVSGGGSGPVVLERNDDYWGEPAKVAKVNVRVIGDVSTRIAALKAGEVDLITKLPPDATENVPVTFEGPSVEHNYLGYNSKNGVTSDPRVREAMNLAIDRQALADDLWAGYAVPSKCQVGAPDATGYNDTLEPWAYDPERAKQLIEEAGATGKSLKLSSGRFFPKGAEAAEAIAAYWEAVGLKVDVTVHPDPAQYAPEYFSKFKRPEATFVLGSDDLFDQTSTARVLTTDGDASSYSNPEVDKLFEESYGMADLAERDATLQKVMELVCADAGVGDLLNPKDLWGGTDQVEWTPRADDGSQLYIPPIGFKN